MNLQMIQIDPTVARREYEAYREAVRANAERRVFGLETRAAQRRAEMERADEAIMRGYQELSKGKPIIDLRMAIAAGGQDAAGRPKIAVARADDAEIECDVWRSGRVEFRPARAWGDIAARSVTRVFDFLGLFPADPTKDPPTARAKAPYIPPAIRPVGSLDRYHLLWEADWRKLPPRDPALLRSIGGGLYLVLATWDLTDLEASVLSRAG